MKKIVSLFALALAFGATTASADPLMTYDYLDAAYQWRHNDGHDLEDSNGLDTKLSVSPLENFALEGGYNYARADVLKNGFNFNQWTYGVVGFYEICPGIHVLARGGAKHFNTNGSVAGVDISDGVERVYGGLGSRYLLTDDIEVDADITYTAANETTINGGGPNWNYAGTGFLTVAENVALKAGVSIDNNTNVALTGGVRVTM
jgi:hypothetical protein